MENQEKQFRLNVTRRHFLTKAGLGFGSAALGSMLFKDQLFGADPQSSMPLGLAQYAPKASGSSIFFKTGLPPNWKHLITNPCSTRCMVKNCLPPFAWVKGLPA